MNYRKKGRGSFLLPVSKNSSSDEMKTKSLNRILPYGTLLLGNLLIAIFFTVFLTVSKKISYTLAFLKCNWNKWENWGEDAQPRRIALIADPQLVDASSYLSNLPVVHRVASRLSDNFLRDNYKKIKADLDPDTIIFLGDMFDGGREWEDKYWLKELKRFQRLFPQDPTTRSIHSIPGNHDIGFQEMTHSNFKRFETYFGNTNTVVEIGNHTLVLLDNISLSSTDEWFLNRVQNFLDSLLERLSNKFPRILLSHVPLYRFRKEQLCGPLREKKGLFPIQKGHQYQTVIEYETPQNILRSVRPNLVFSGDDHDYCDVTHSYNVDDSTLKAREITVKSSSMAGGIRYPAIQLLSLYNPDDSSPQANTYETEMCYMPDIKLRLLCFGILVILLGAIVVNAIFLGIRLPHKSRFQLPVQYGKRLIYFVISSYLLTALSVFITIEVIF